MSKKVRVSKFELLRIIAMYLIVLHHSIVHGVIDVNKDTLLMHPATNSIAVILGMGGKIGVFLFILITGYFMVNSHITLGKIIKLWLPIFFWSIILFFIVGVPLHQFTVLNLVRAVFPITFNQYWFMTVYFFMYLLIPILNNIVNWINSKQKKIYFIILGLIIAISGCPILFGGPEQIGSTLLVFCFVYCVGALLRKNDFLTKKNLVKKSNFILLLLFLLEVFLIIVLTWLSAKFDSKVILLITHGLAFDYWALFVILEAIGIFIWLGSTEIGYHPLINKIASLVFGIYLISDNNYVRDFLWETILHMNNMIDKNPIIMASYAIVASAIVFIISGCLEYIRKFTFRKLESYFSIQANQLQYKMMSKIK